MYLALLNTTVITADGKYTCKTVSLLEARGIVRNVESVRSYIGHESTVNLVSGILGIDIEFNRGLFTQQPGQNALCWKLDGRAPNGVELSIEDIEEIGYTFKLLTRLD